VFGCVDAASVKVLEQPPEQSAALVVIVTVMLSARANEQAPMKIPIANPNKNIELPVNFSLAINGAYRLLNMTYLGCVSD
jgi:hypothetical protein